MKDNCSPLATWLCVPLGKEEWVFSYYRWMWWLVHAAAITFKRPILGGQGWDEILQFCSKEMNSNGFPWWRSGWESACQCRGRGFEPWSGKISHAAEQLGPWATTTEPARLEPVLRNRRGRDSERPAHHDEEWAPLAATRESPCTETKTQHS